MSSARSTAVLTAEQARGIADELARRIDFLEADGSIDANTAEMLSGILEWLGAFHRGVAGAGVESAPFRDWKKTSVGDDGGFLIYRLASGKMAATIVPLLLVEGGEGSVYRWTAGEDLALWGDQDNIFSAQRAAHEAMTRAAELPALRPRSTRIQVFNAADAETARKLALSVAVCQEVALLFDAIDRGGLTTVDLSEWSRLRAVGEAWWVECGFTSRHLDAWLTDLEGQELAPGVPAARQVSAPAPTTTDEEERPA